MKERVSRSLLTAIGLGLIAIGLLVAAIQPFNRCLFPRGENLAIVCTDTMPFYMLTTLAGFILIGVITISAVNRRLAS